MKKGLAFQLLLILILLCVFTVIGCKQAPKTDRADSGIEADSDININSGIDGSATVEHVVRKCQILCQQAKSAGQDLSAGPCLSDGRAFASDWVCDVAHSPRAEIDNEPANQCKEFREGKARHFVEVNENCELIKKY